MNEDVRKHLELTQAIIGRMAANSFLLKGWTITLSAALFALSASETRWEFALLALFPTLSFWGMDAYYLRQERLYRALYNDIRRGGSDLQIAKSVEPYSLETSQYLQNVDSWRRTLFAGTIVSIHLAVLGAVLLVCLFLVLQSRAAPL